MEILKILACSVLMLFPAIVAQEDCEVTTSLLVAGMVDVHCSCDQQLIIKNLNIHQLSINYTGCIIPGLQIDWMELETSVKPTILVLEGSDIVLPEASPSSTWESYITHIYFINCGFMDIKNGAFTGLDELQELRFLNSYIVELHPYAISGLNLTAIEISDTVINIINEFAFSSLMYLEEFSITFSDIGVIKEKSIFNFDDSISVPNDCAPDSNKDDNMITAMGRSLHFTHNLTLPDYGRKILFYKNTIEHISTNSIVGNTFAFLIIGGNIITQIEPKSFNLELNNQCEISAALIVGNNITDLGSQTFVNIKGNKNSEKQTFLAFVENNFTDISSKGFLLDKSISVFAVEKNKFKCKCDNFDWVLSDVFSEPQRELETQLVMKGQCLEVASSVIDFSDTCFNRTATKPPNSSDQPIDGSDSFTVAPIPPTSPGKSSRTHAHTALLLSLAFTLISLIK